MAHCASSFELLADRRGLLLAAMVAPFALSAGATQGRAPVWLVQSEPAGVYAEAAIAVREAWDPQRGTLLVGTWADLLGSGPVMPRLVLALGVGALRQVHDRAKTDAAWARVPVLAALLPRAAYDGATAAPPPGHQMSAVLLDQPPERYFDLIKLAMPERRRVGLLLGPDTRELKPVLTRLAAARDLQLTTGEPLSEDVYPALQSVLASCDVLLILYDRFLFQSGALQNILITAYRRRVPVLSYSATHVKAGATLGLYTMPAQAGRQLAGAAATALAGQGLPPVQVADAFAVSVNAQVAHSLGLTLSEPSTLTDALRRKGGAR